MECHAYAKALRCREQHLYSHFDMHAINLGVPAPRAKMTPELLATVEDMIRIYQARVCVCVCVCVCACVCV